MSPKLLAAAARLVAARGPQGFTMEDLAQAAKVSRATLYRQAGSREAVLDALSQSGTPVGDRTETRARILAAARIVFGRTGFDGSTVEEIATEANVGVVTVYRHFGDKDGLVGAFIDEYSPRKFAREVSAAASGDLRRDLENLACRILTAVHDDPSIFRLVLLETMRGGPVIPRVRALSPWRTLTGIVSLLQPHADAGHLRSADLQSLAQSFGGILFAHGILGPILGGRPLVDPEATARAVTELFLHGAFRAKKERK